MSESKALLLRLWREKPAFADEGAWRGPRGCVLASEGTQVWCWGFRLRGPWHRSGIKATRLVRSLSRGETGVRVVCPGKSRVKWFWR